MDEFLLIGIFILVFIGFPIIIGSILYFVPKKLGYSKTGIYLTIIFSLFVLVVILMTVFEDDLFTKNDALELIEEQEIVLTENFKIENNQSTWAIGDYYHTFTLNISQKDKARGIQKIKNSPNFKKLGEPIKDLYFDSKDSYTIPKQIQNYETEKSFVREYIKSNEDGYAPTYRRIKIYKLQNKLVFEDIDY